MQQYNWLGETVLNKTTLITTYWKKLTSEKSYMIPPIISNNT